jgi:hypothetical protein
MGKKILSSILFVINFYKNKKITFIISFVNIYLFIFQVTKVLSIASPTTPAFQKLCEICHVVDVIICSTNDVHCNVVIQNQRLIN